MKKIISFGKIEIAFIIILFLFFVFELIENFIDDENRKKYEYESIIDNNELILKLITSLVETLCFIPELIRKKNSSVNSSQKEYKLTTKNYFQILFVSFVSLIADFSSILFNRAEENSLLVLNYVLTLLFVSLISIFLFKNEYYKHQYISLALIIIISLSKELYNIVDHFKTVEHSEWLMNLLPYIILLLIIKSVFLSLSIGTSKYCMEAMYISPYKLTYIVGIIKSVVLLILCIITSVIPCREDFSYFCWTQADDVIYFDSFISFFNKKEQLLSAFSSMFFFAIIGLLINIFIQKYTLFHYILYMKISSCIQFIQGLIFYEDYSAGYIIREIIFDVVDVILLLIFLEFIELNFCGLNENLKKNIMKRADDELISDKTVDSRVNINGYIVDFDNPSKMKEEEDLRKKKGESPMIEMYNQE